MSKAPIFDEKDLPAELQGKTAEEQAAYWRRRTELAERHRSAPPAPKAPEPKKDDLKVDVFGDATGSVNRIVDAKVNERMSQLEQTATPALVTACRMDIRDRHVDYPTFAKEIESEMAKMQPANQIKGEFWEMTYQMVKGKHADEMIAAARAEASKPAVERSTPKGGDPPKPRELSQAEEVIAGKFNMEPAHYRTAAERYDSTEGRLPFTTDNRNKNRKKAS